MITTWLITLISFFLGYGLATWVKTPTLEQQKVIKQTIDKLRGKHKLGMVKSIGADESNLRKNKVLLEEDKLMTAEFDSLLGDE